LEDSQAKKRKKIFYFLLDIVQNLVIIVSVWLIVLLAVQTGSNQPQNNLFHNYTSFKRSPL